MNNYLGKRGYSIYKKSLSLKEQQEIKDDLNVRPYVPNSPIQMESFPIYRESPLKLYVPRYYGIKKFGEPLKSVISEGDDIDIEFKGSLRDYQVNITNKYYNEATKSKYGGGGLLDIYAGAGKTVMALNIVSRIKKKTLIIVHKGFLVQQWKERIEQYLPNARVGKIQAQIVDIENKDIVIGMLQSLSMKEYHENQFDSFGFTIVDEVHHISSEVFSRSLSKIVTKYTLGLSATMQRKDGLTKVFKMFLGEIIHKENRDKEHQVLIKSINYKIEDDEFNEVEYDFRGNPKFSTMISKLCNFNPRREFILEILKREIERDNTQQIIVLAHNKSLLIYLYDAIEHRNIGTVGYYLGGMKEKALKESESKQIIIATYAMAAEALDIKSLTTLVLATPKTDVVQAVGRILRQKGHQPIVLDIIDSHEPFYRQWMKRKSYYSKEGYKIINSKSPEHYYKNEWKTIYEPKSNKTNRSNDNMDDNEDEDENEKNKKNICLLDLSNLV